MSELAGWQKQYLRGMAHHLKPMIQVGKLGMTPALVETIRKALDDHELIKIKFLDFKDEKQEISERIVAATDAEFVGLIGNVLTIYRESSDEDKRFIHIPEKK
ncbi:MAG TPA: ribosome assembly RNA-binding protein YhbY [Spirochaetota bacterium]|nr:ribosome assembly RNA-binding protein YhbY [Spirochaetota bacterium]